MKFIKSGWVMKFTKWWWLVKFTKWGWVVKSTAALLPRRGICSAFNRRLPVPPEETGRF